MEDPLAVLSALNNEDKHRVLVPAIGSLRAIGFGLTSATDVAPLPKDFGEVVFVPLVDGAPLLHIDVTATGPDPKVDVEITERVEITIDQGVELADGTRLVRTRIDLQHELEAILDRLRYIFKIFVPEFG